MMTTNRQATKQQVPDGFGGTRNKCDNPDCNKPAYIYTGEKSICLDCAKKETDNAR